MNTIYRISFVLFVLVIVHPLNTNAKTSFTVVLDAGHGGRDPGTKGVKVKEKEINLAVALLVGKYIAEDHPDVKVIYTRKTDVAVELLQRAAIANANADLFISIHCNAAVDSKTKKPNPNVQGMEVWSFGIKSSPKYAQDHLDVIRRENEVIKLEDNYQEKYKHLTDNTAYIWSEFIQNACIEQSLELALMTADELKKNVSWKDRGVKQHDGYIVLRNIAMPGILIELDFLTNPEAENFLVSAAGQEKQARSIVRAFTRYKNNYDRKNNLKSNPETKPEIRPEAKIETQPEIKKDPPVVVENPKQGGSIYKIQILAGRNLLPANSSELKGYQTAYYVENNLYKYTYGESSDLNEIKSLRKSVLKDFKDAFIVRFENGVKVETIY